jgi:putative nucleotidyltransferase with HDIG domain
MPFVVQSTHLLWDYLQFDPETAAHSWRVSQLATRLARHLNCSAGEIAVVRSAALLHDIGKALIPASILQKPTKLTSEEYRIMQQHPVHSYDILRAYAPATPHWQHISTVILHHHEHWNGNGYPAQLAGTAIPYAARICAVADVWDALISTRVYRPGLEPSAATAQMRAEAGYSLDPHMVDVFLAMPPRSILSGMGSVGGQGSAPPYR